MAWPWRSGRLIRLSRDKGQQARRDVFDDRVFDAVEMRLARFPVIRVFGDADDLIGLEFDEFERAGADRRVLRFPLRVHRRADRPPRVAAGRAVARRAQGAGQGDMIEEFCREIGRRVRVTRQGRTKSQTDLTDGVHLAPS
jgi:hypothetical protein